jgi:hypothetical protein
MKEKRRQPFQTGAFSRMAGRLIAVILEKSHSANPPTATTWYWSVWREKRSKLVGEVRGGWAGGIGGSEYGHHASFFNRRSGHGRLTKAVVAVRVSAFRDGLELCLRQRDETVRQKPGLGRPV